MVRRNKKRKVVEKPAHEEQHLSEHIIEQTSIVESNSSDTESDRSLSGDFIENDYEPIDRDILKPLFDDLETQIPTEEKILSAQLTKNDKQKCFRLFLQFKNTEPNSSEWFRLIDSINEILNIKYSLDEIQFLDREEEKLSQIDFNPDSLKYKILKLNANDQIKAKILAMYNDMITYPEDSSIYSSLKEEIEWSIRMPYEKREIDPYVKMKNTELNSYYCQIKQQLDKELYGMEKVKERIIHILNDRRSSADSCGRNIVLCGPPGTGKTQIGKTLAKVLNKKFAKISAATLDSSAIKGSNKVYVGSEPSIFLQTLASLKTNNPVIMIDEAEKMDSKAQYAMLHISDTGDNNEFQDNYLKNFYHDLSKILIIYNVNSVNGLDSALLDRMDILYVEDYSVPDKVNIFKNYMLPKSLINVGFGPKDVIVKDAAITKLLTENDSSLRTVERLIKNLVGKVNMYKNVILPNGTLGELKLSYHIPNFKLPLTVDYSLLRELAF